MPTYEYLCENCGHRFEKFQKMTDNPLKECPECGKKVKRLIGTGMGFIFKGTGFYATDYRNSGFSGKTCCGRNERCEKPPCSDDGTCKR
ncbi:MAG: zinc ribbon domain-containing protein [Candidatus Aureabacteria bacterium]|nr:zinc ribbon domain-containing protein [Candidatus Auribacterota bacterium]